MNALSGCRSLTWLALRRDRFKLPAYVLGLSLLTLGMLAGIGGQNRQALVDEAELFASTPATAYLRCRLGRKRGRDDDDPRLSAARRARRADERALGRPAHAAERGDRARRARRRRRSSAATPAWPPRSSSPSAPTSLSLSRLQLAGIAAGQPTFGSFTAGMATGALGIVFAGVAAVTVQLSSTTRGASGFAAAVLGLAFVVSGVGNMLGHASTRAACVL